MVSMKEKFRDAGYTVKTFSENDIKNRAGCVDGFTFTLSVKDSNTMRSTTIYGWVCKFNKKDLAVEAKELIEPADNRKVSLKNDIYLCYVFESRYDDLPSLDEFLVVLDVFDSCFA